MENEKAVDNKGLGVIRIKPLGIGGGGGESRSKCATSALKYTESSVIVDGKSFNYPKMVVDPDTNQKSLFNEFMPNCIDGFLNGYNVNIIAYGQTGSGKTYTMFGPPGCMKKAAIGEYGRDVHEDYGLFPRGLIDIFNRLAELKISDPCNSYVLTCSAVELSVMGNEDMFIKSGTTKPAYERGRAFRSSSCGVVLDRSQKPPKLYGQIEIVIDKEEDLRRAFSAISVRNTSGTLMNDSSSRSHCIVALTIWKYDKISKKVRTSRFQFCDLAGSERLKDAHGNGVAYKKPNGEWNMEVLQGVATNFSLMELSRCLQDIAMVRNAKGNFSFRAYLTDLLFLLSDSLVGNSLTACFICVSQAERNKGESRNALDFGSRFARLSINRKKMDEEYISEMEYKASNSIQTNQKHLKTTRVDNHYASIREACIRDSEQILNVINILCN